MYLKYATQGVFRFLDALHTFKIAWISPWKTLPKMPEKWKGETVNSHFKRNQLIRQIFFCQEEGQKNYDLYSDTIEPALIFQVRKMLKERYLRIFSNPARSVWYQAITSLCSNEGFCGATLAGRRNLYLLSFLRWGGEIKVKRKLRLLLLNFFFPCSWGHNLLFIVSFHTVSKWT